MKVCICGEVNCRRSGLRAGHRPYPSPADLECGQLGMVLACNCFCHDDPDEDDKTRAKSREIATSIGGCGCSKACWRWQP